MESDKYKSSNKAYLVNLVEMQNNNAKEEEKRKDSRPAILRLGLIGLTKVINTYQIVKK